VPRTWPIAGGRLRSIVEGDWHYIERQDGRAELYNVVADPMETHDRSSSAEGRDVLPRLRGSLAQHAPHGVPAVVDHAAAAHR
jgi:hypothetical protein